MNSGTAIAQNESDERALLEVKNGISISKDSLFLLNLRFRMQNRFGIKTESGDDFEIEQVDFRVRRLRLRLDGYVLSKKLQYYIQLGFSKSDLDLEGGHMPSQFEMQSSIIIQNPISTSALDNQSFRETESEW